VRGVDSSAEFRTLLRREASGELRSESDIRLRSALIGTPPFVARFSLSVGASGSADRLTPDSGDTNFAASRIILEGGPPLDALCVLSRHFPSARPVWTAGYSSSSSSSSSSRPRSTSIVIEMSRSEC
jgi:hypothetical protein